MRGNMSENKTKVDTNPLTAEQLIKQFEEQLLFAGKSVQEMSKVIINLAQEHRALEKRITQIANRIKSTEVLLNRLKYTLNDKSDNNVK